jgi:hypothetical protein
MDLILFSLVLLQLAVDAGVTQAKMEVMAALVVVVGQMSETTVIRTKVLTGALVLLVKALTAVLVPLTIRVLAAAVALTKMAIQTAKATAVMALRRPLQVLL